MGGVLCVISGSLHVAKYILKAQKVQNLVTTKSVMEYKISEGMKK